MPKRNHRQNAGSDNARPSACKPLQEAIVPSQLVGREEGKIILTFAPHLAYVKVKISTVNDNLRITCNRKTNQECTFVFNFKSHDDHKQSFEIKARMIEEESEEPILILCSGKDNKPLDDAEQFWITLKPQPKPPDNIFISLFQWIWYISKKWYIRYPLLFVLLVGVLFYFHVPPTDKIREWGTGMSDRVQIKWLHTKDPVHYTQPWSDLFLPTNDNRPDQSKWIAPKEWTLVNGENDNPNDKALSIGGDGVGLIKLPSDLHALYDYTVTIKLNITESQRSAAWLLRAQNPQDYYLFELTLPTKEVNEAKLEGFVYSGGVKGESLTKVSAIPLEYFPFHEGDILWITINVSGSEFKHEITLNLLDDEDERNPNFEKQGEGKFRTFSDIGLTEPYRYGAFGFKASGPNSVMKVEKVEITDVK